MPKTIEGSSLGLYPLWTKADPVFAKELLALIALKCRNSECLNEEERSYLANSIGKILRGVPADRAMGLSAKMGAKRRTLSDRNTNIYNQVTILIKKGSSKNKAFKEVAKTALAAKKTGSENLSYKAVEKIYSEMRLAVFSSENTKRKK